MKYLFFTILSIISSLPLFGVNFSEVNLASDDRLLYKAEFESQNAAFISTLDNNSIQQLTAFPEKLQLTDNGRSILVTNRFGITRIPIAGGLPAQIQGYPSFAQGSMPLKGRLQEAASSGDGRWVVFIEPASPAYGTLYIVNTSNGAKRIVSEKIELPAKDFPVKWSPDSRLFVYVKDNSLYYFPIMNDPSVMVDERFRLMGQGSINSVVWGQQGDFFYISGNTLYSINNPELFTRTIYGDFLSVGKAALILPFEFDLNFDRYWIAPDSKVILINKNNKGMFLFLLREQAANISLPHIPILPGAENINVLWSSSGKVRINYSISNLIISSHYEFAANNIRNIQTSGVPVSPNGILSPDGTKAVFWGEQGLELWDFNNWRLIQKIFSEPVISCIWVNNDRFITGNKKFISEINISGTTMTQRRICLSGADQTGFEASARGQLRALARIGAEWYATDTRSGWTLVNEPVISSARSYNAASLLSRHTASKAYPQKNSVKIALCFDLYDDDTGLYHVLSSLKQNNIKATFFLNGEFIRRNPAAAREIAESGHETGSMFYAPIDFSDSRYRITRDFITRGLARNQDEFFNVTGKELGRVWHPPFYRSSSLINSSASEAGYTTIEKTLDLFDWVSREESKRLNIYQMSSSQMIEQIIAQGKNEAVIPIRLGTLSGGRDEYLYQRIDVLLDALVRSGIEVVPVSQVSR